jgi:hypothetical protein
VHVAQCEAWPPPSPSQPPRVGMLLCAVVFIAACGILFAKCALGWVCLGGTCACDCCRAGVMPLCCVGWCPRCALAPRVACGRHDPGGVLAGHGVLFKAARGGRWRGRPCTGGRPSRQTEVRVQAPPPHQTLPRTIRATDYARYAHTRAHTCMLCMLCMLCALCLLCNRLCNMRNGALLWMRTALGCATLGR